MLDIVYQDAHFVAINKPHGLLVHRSPIAKDATTFALQQLRDQLNQKVYPLHRLDRKTGGVLLFTLNKDLLGDGQQLFAKGAVKKEYLAIVRGHTDDSGCIDYSLKKENGQLQDAVTYFTTIDRCELPVPFLKHATSRYSLIKVIPETGRMHQIRKHMSHILHPIIGDRPHGCNKQNKLFKEKWDMITMMLHASELTFRHPVENHLTGISAPLQSEFKRMVDMMGLYYQ